MPAASAAIRRFGDEITANAAIPRNKAVIRLDTALMRCDGETCQIVAR
jgi:hypothetical protein